MSADAEKRPGGHQSASMDHLAGRAENKPTPCRAADFERWAKRAVPGWVELVNEGDATLTELFDLFESARTERRVRVKR